MDNGKSLAIEMVIGGLLFIGGLSVSKCVETRDVPEPTRYVYLQDYHTIGSQEGHPYLQTKDPSNPDANFCISCPISGRGTYEVRIRNGKVSEILPNCKAWGEFEIADAMVELDKTSPVVQETYRNLCIEDK
ncbi:MAG: hypothetical protein WCV90_07925 [Candidatus Woesearchaeota archaeon]|jgi:hypothetical protein